MSRESSPTPFISRLLPMLSHEDRTTPTTTTTAQSPASPPRNNVTDTTTTIPAAVEADDNTTQTAASSSTTPRMPILQIGRRILTPSHPSLEAAASQDPGGSGAFHAFTTIDASRGNTNEATGIANARLGGSGPSTLQRQPRVITLRGDRVDYALSPFSTTNNRDGDELSGTWELGDFEGGDVMMRSDSDGESGEGGSEAADLWRMDPDGRGGGGGGGAGSAMGGRARRPAVSSRVRRRREREEDLKKGPIAPEDGTGLTLGSKPRMLPPIPSYLRQHPLRGEAVLPTHFSLSSSSKLLAISPSGLSVHFLPRHSTSEDAAAVRADVPVPSSVGLYYYEVEIVSAGERGFIGIGWSSKNVKLDRLPGWEKESFAYHGDDGLAFREQGEGKSYAQPFTTGDIIGCGLDFAQGCGFYTKNGVFLGDLFHGMNQTGLYPSIGLRTAGEIVQANFGHKPFRYDIDSYANLRRTTLTASTLPSCGPILSSQSFRPPMPSSSSSDPDDDILSLERLTQRLKRETAKKKPNNVTTDLLERVIGMIKNEDVDRELRRSTAMLLIPPELPESEAVQKERKAVEEAKSTKGKGKEKLVDIHASKGGAIAGLVEEYLLHQGMTGTLVALRKNQHSLAAASWSPDNSRPGSATAFPSPPRLSAGKAVAVERATCRARLQGLVVSGEFEEALAVLKSERPALLESGPGILLRCARLVQMILVANPIPTAPAIISPKPSVPSKTTDSHKRKLSPEAAEAEDGPGRLKSARLNNGLASSESAIATITTVTTADVIPPPPRTTPPPTLKDLLTHARTLQATLRARQPDDPLALRDLLSGCLGLLAYENPREPSIRQRLAAAGKEALALVEPEGRESIAEKVIGLIRESDGLSARPELEDVVRHAIASHRALIRSGDGLAALVEARESVLGQQK